MVYGYVRVSTEKQTSQNQKLAISEWAKHNDITIDEFIDETKSGALSPEERKLGGLLDRLQEGDTLIVTEISRLGRSILMILNILQKLLDKKIVTYAIKENFKLQDDLNTKVLAFAFGLSAEVERQLIIERTNAGLARAKLAGVHCGRAKGRKSDHVKLDKYKKKITDLYEAGVSINSLAHLFRVRWVTIQSYLKRQKIYKPNRSAEYKVNLNSEQISHL